MANFPKYSKAIPFMRPIPDVFKDIQRKEIKVLERGERSYLCKVLEVQKLQYRVMERILMSDSWGFMEVLNDYQRYQSFETLQDAIEHFQRYELGFGPLMLSTLPDPK